MIIKGHPMKRVLPVLGLAAGILLSPVLPAAAGGLVVGDILVSDIGNGTVDMVNPVTGVRSVFSGGGVARGRHSSILAGSPSTLSVT